MAYTFADYPEIAFAVPFENTSFERWDATLPDQWAQTHSPGAGTRAKYNPGYDSTRALDIHDTGVITSPQNGIKQTLTLPSYMTNGQKTRAGMAALNTVSGYGTSKAVIAVTQNSGALAICNYKYNAVSASWQLCRYDSDADINTSYTDLVLALSVYSSDGAATNPAALFDNVFMEYGRTASERYYTFTRKPEFNGLDAFAETFCQAERTGRGKRRTWDATGGAVKWTLVLPFVNIPLSMVDALEQFVRGNKGLDDKEKPHLVLHHKLIDTSESSRTGLPPWLICDIADEKSNWKYSGGWLGAKLFSGTLTFVEV